MRSTSAPQITHGRLAAGSADDHAHVTTDQLDHINAASVASTYAHSTGASLRWEKRPKALCIERPGTADSLRCTVDVKLSQVSNDLRSQHAREHSRQSFMGRTRLNASTSQHVMELEEACLRRRHMARKCRDGLCNAATVLPPLAALMRCHNVSHPGPRPCWDMLITPHHHQWHWLPVGHDHTRGPCTWH